ncbi:MAG: DUF3800 domain-containing protein [Trichloromonas sp.]|nr:DUF3800 domain-containing protein [Trichloromonas sp.]
MKFRIYIDEVGNSDLASSDNPNHRFLSLTGVIIELGHVETTVFPQLEALKTKYFRSHPDEPVILHRKEMVNHKRPFEHLKDPEVKRSFDAELLALLQAWDYAVVSVCIDKRNHKETYQVWRYDPYHYCLAILLERYWFFLNEHGAKGDVMAESRGGKEDMRLKDSFAKLWAEGTEYISSERFHTVLTSKQLKVKNKTNNVAGLQLADLLPTRAATRCCMRKGFLRMG